ncbi:MAG: ATPase [Candidatus Acidoferrum typicum]|nr:ATPase [Candidatus Acidoferrum typicum]
MTNEGNLKVTTRGDREIVMTRAFDAPRKLVFDAFTKPELVKQWLLGPPGWSMPVCEIDLRVRGTYRYVWRKAGVPDMGMGGVYREIVVPERVVATEKFDQAWYQGEAVGTLVLIEQGGKTAVTQTMVYESPETRDTVLKSGMEKGVKASYDRMAELLARGLEKGASNS